MNTEIQTFVNNDFGQITAIERDGEPWFVAKDISDILGYSLTEKMTRRLDDDEKTTIPFWDSPTNVTQKIIINEFGLYEAIFGSKMPQAKAFKRWIKRDVLPSIRKHGHYKMGEVPKSASAVECFELQLLGLEYCAKILNCSESSKLQLLHAAHEYNGVPTASLPVYTENVRVTFSAKDLLEKNHCGISTIAFNKLMVEAGFMEEKKRSSKKGIKKFKSLTEKGLEYGQNDASKHNPRETQPHYFEDTFMDLFELIKR